LVGARTAKTARLREVDNFSKVIDKAMLACDVAGFDVAEHFPARGFGCLASEQLQLLGCVAFGDPFSSRKNFHLAKLLVCYADNPDLTGRRQRGFHPTDMYLGILAGGAMSQVNRKLEHREAIAHEVFAKLGGLFPLLFCLGRQIEKHKHPHNPIFRKTFHYISG
jgi:hypothetical protein